MSKSINVTLIALHVLIIELKPIGNFNVHFILLNLFYKQKASQDMKKKKKKITIKFECMCHAIIRIKALLRFFYFLFKLN